MPLSSLDLQNINNQARELAGKLAADGSLGHSDTIAIEQIVIMHDRKSHFFQFCLAKHCARSFDLADPQASAAKFIRSIGCLSHTFFDIAVFELKIALRQQTGQICDILLLLPPADAQDHAHDYLCKYFAAAWTGTSAIDFEAYRANKALEEACLIFQDIGRPQDQPQSPAARASL